MYVDLPWEVTYKKKSRLFPELWHVPTFHHAISLAIGVSYSSHIEGKVEVKQLKIDEFQTECPAIGVLGIHSEEYYEDSDCIYCGERGPLGRWIDMEEKGSMSKMEMYYQLIMH